MRDGEWCPEDIADLRRWCAEGVNVREMASRLNRSIWAIYRKTNDLNVPVLARSPYRKGIGRGNYHAPRIDPEVAWKRLLDGRRF